MSSFAVQLQQFADKTNKRANDIVGRVAVGIAQRLDERSPVGNPSTWKQRADIADNGDLIQHGAPAGYVGGRFRGNWQLGIGVVPSGETGRIDPTGDITLSTIIATIPEQPAGTVMYLANNVPYAQRLEEGWSRQAPTGLVAITAMEFQQVVDQAAAEVPQ